MKYQKVLLNMSESVANTRLAPVYFTQTNDIAAGRRPDPNKLMGDSGYDLKADKNDGWAFNTPTSPKL